LKARELMRALQQTSGSTLTTDDRNKATKDLPASIKKTIALQPPPERDSTFPQSDFSRASGYPSDNNNTRFAMLALWVAGRHKVPTQRCLALVVRRFRTSQTKEGSWDYFLGAVTPEPVTPAMCTAGLIGLAVAHGLKDGVLGDKSARLSLNEPSIKSAMKYLSNHVGSPLGSDSIRPENRETINVFFLWSLSCVGVLYNVKTFDGKDWYQWGAELLVDAQNVDGSWHPIRKNWHPPSPAEGQVENKELLMYKGSYRLIDTSFALLFLKRADFLRDLSEKIRGERDGRDDNGQDMKSPNYNETSAARKDKKDKDGKPADRLREAKSFTNSLGMKMILIRPGTFLMGSPDGKTPPGVSAEEERFSDETPHRVTLTRGFFMASTLVTQAQWEEVMGENSNHSPFKGKDDEEKRRLPVASVSWIECQAFCKRLSARESMKYELPTEAEWEYACRAGSLTPFWWGSSISTDQANYDGKFAYGKDGKKTKVDRAKPTPVDEFPTNPWRLHDMHGNLYQWCQDYYNPYPTEDVKDPVSTQKGETDARVLRGGSWSDVPGNCRAAFRERIAPGFRPGNYGCRVVCRLE
jgi:formylglycine-generating enzyme required for sulfatase activity